MQTIKPKKIYHLNYIPFLFLLKLALILSASETHLRNLINFSSEIHLTTNGQGEQYFLSNSYSGAQPNEVIVNGITVNYTGNKCYMEEKINNVTLIFNEQISTCGYMFYYLTNIIEIDLSNFNTFEVINMTSMFSRCLNLEKINFGNINTSSLKNMYSLFKDCINLTSIDLTIFDTSYIQDMGAVFSGCSNLEKINFGNISTSSVNYMDYLFSGCSKLLTLNLSTFDTSQVRYMNGMFYNCSNLKYLDLSSFNTSKLRYIDYNLSPHTFFILIKKLCFITAAH